MIEFFAPGTPKPQGSKRIVSPRGRPVLIEQVAYLGKWRLAIAEAAMAAMQGRDVLAGAVALNAIFAVHQPKRPKHPRPTSRRAGDLDKHLRAACDAMTGIVFHDDSQVVIADAAKIYASPSGAWFAVDEVDDVGYQIAMETYQMAARGEKRSPGRTVLRLIHGGWPNS